MPAAIRRITATGILVVVTAIVSLLVTALGLDFDAAIRGGFIPARLTHWVGFDGGLWAVPVWLTPLSAALLHGGAFHLLMNMVMLGFCGQQVERVLGPRMLVLLYLIGAYAAAAGQWLPDPESMNPMVGASGATSALVGAYALLFGRSRAKAIGPIPAQFVHVLWLLAAWIGINLLMGVAFQQGGMLLAIGAHIGGFLAGLLLARPMLLWRWRAA